MFEGSSGRPASPRSAKKPSAPTGRSVSSRGQPRSFSWGTSAPGTAVTATSSTAIPPPEETEPERVAEAARKLGLRYVVVTSVTRDDLEDGGAAHFARTIASLRRQDPARPVEVLIPDFQGSPRAMETVARAFPDVVNHNLEVVQSLFPSVRPGGDYRRSLDLLETMKKNTDS